MTNLELTLQFCKTAKEEIGLAYDYGSMEYGCPPEIEHGFYVSMGFQDLNFSFDEDGNFLEVY